MMFLVFQAKRKRKKLKGRTLTMTMKKGKKAEIRPTTAGSALSSSVFPFCTLVLVGIDFFSFPPFSTFRCRFFFLLQKQSPIVAKSFNNF